MRLAIVINSSQAHGPRGCSQARFQLGYILQIALDRPTGALDTGIQSSSLETHSVVSDAINNLSVKIEGTILGGLCFLLYFDCMKKIFPPEIRFKIYADDLKLYAPVRSDAEHGALQKAADDFLAWTRKMSLQVCTQKCCVFHYGPTDRRL